MSNLFSITKLFTAHKLFHFPQKKPALFLPYCIIMILNSILFFAIAIFSFVHSAILYGVIGLAVAALEIYFAYVVYMYKRIVSIKDLNPFIIFCYLYSYFQIYFLYLKFQLKNKLFHL